MMDYGIVRSREVIVTSEAGDRLAQKQNIEFRNGQAKGVTVNVQPDKLKQTMLGIGSSFTESSAFVLAHLGKASRAELMERVYGKGGANFSLARTTIASTDFSVEGKYSYAPVVDDKELKHFSIGVDEDGFSQATYPGIRDESFDLLPMIRQALAIKESEGEALRIIASAWTAPAWMKDIEDWFIKPTAENNYQGTGGMLKQKYVATYADYLIKYLDAYKAEGVEIWGMTPVNEPEGNSGQWESMHFTPDTERHFIKQHLGPRLKASQHKDVNLLIYDQNRDHLEKWTDTILGDSEAAAYVYGTAVHWYSSTYKVYEKELEKVHNKYPDFDIIHTEGTIDDLGKPAPGGVLDPEKFQESGWFGNDAFWWNKNATDWAYSATWAPNSDDHPVYTPVHRYARNIIVSFNHWVSGWVDWNIVLDHKGGPNHAGNFCGAPIMIHTETGEVYYTPIYYVLAQLSRSIRPGDRAVQTDLVAEGLDSDAVHASATLNDDAVLSVQLLNTTKQPLEFKLQIGKQYAEVNMPANALQTVRVQLAEQGRQL